jgi:hypothetical protein
MPAPLPGRPTAALDCGAAAAVLLAGAAALPLGLEGPASVPLLTGGYTLGAVEGAAARSPLAAMVVRLFACLPLGDLPTRASLASVALTALAAVLLARLAAETLAATREGMVGRGPDVRAGHELVAAGAGAVLPLACLNVFLPLTSATAAAASLALLAAGWLRVARLLRSPGRARDGLTLAGLIGLALAADAVAAVLLTPLALGCWLRAFRKGERWSLIAPVPLLAGMALALFDPAAGVGGGPLARMGALFPAGLAGAMSPTDDLIAELGVVAGLVALAGFVVLVLRAPLVAGLVMASAVVAMAVHAGGAAGPGAWVALVALLGLPLAIGVAHLGSKLGRARAATATVVAVMALVSPALDGGGRRFQRSTLLPEALLREAHAELGPRLRVDAGSATMRGLLRYGQVLGLRPDLQISPWRPPGRPPLASRRLAGR